MNYGTRLKNLIKNKGYSQKEIAAMLNVPETTLSDWTIKDVPPLESIVSVCNILQVSVSRFFSEEGESFVELTSQERDLVKAFGEFTEEKRRDLLRILEILKGF